MTDHATNDPGQQLIEPLTRREREILALLGQGLSGPEIAEKLTLAKSSVKWHIQQLYAKLSVNSKEQAIRRAQALGLLAAQSTPAPAAMAGHPSTDHEALPNIPRGTVTFLFTDIEGSTKLPEQLREGYAVLLADQ